MNKRQLTVVAMLVASTLTMATQIEAASSCVCKDKAVYLKANAYCGYCTPKQAQKPVSPHSTQLFWFSNKLSSYKAAGCTITSWTDACQHGGSCNSYGVQGTITSKSDCMLNGTKTYGIVGTMAAQAKNNGCTWTCK